MSVISISALSSATPESFFRRGYYNLNINHIDNSAVKFLTFRLRYCISAVTWRTGLQSIFKSLCI